MKSLVDVPALITSTLTGFGLRRHPARLALALAILAGGSTSAFGQCPAECNGCLAPPGAEKCEEKVAKLAVALASNLLSNCYLMALQHGQPLGADSCEVAQQNTFVADSPLAGCPSCFQPLTVATVVREVFDQAVRDLKCASTGEEVLTQCTPGAVKKIAKSTKKLAKCITKAGRANSHAGQPLTDPGACENSTEDKCRALALPEGCCLRALDVCKLIRERVDVHVGLVACAGTTCIFPPTTTTTTTPPPCDSSALSCIDKTCPLGQTCVGFGPGTCFCQSSTPTTTLPPCHSVDGMFLCAGTCPSAGMVCGSAGTGMCQCFTPSP